jgi:hypothetical protein
MRSIAAALLVAGALAVGAPAVAADVTRSCGSVLVTFAQSEGSATRILATRVSCRRARVVARACVGGYLKGWRPRVARERIRLTRADAVVSLQLAGGGGENCYS